MAEDVSTGHDVHQDQRQRDRIKRPHPPHSPSSGRNEVGIEVGVRLVPWNDDRGGAGNRTTATVRSRLSFGERTIPFVQPAVGSVVLLVHAKARS